MAVSNKSEASTRKATPAAIREVSRENNEDSPVVGALRQQLANAFLLYLNYKHYHWQTHGPLFRDLHKLFDEFAGEVLASTDELAERIRMIGQDPPSTPSELERLATVTPSDTVSSMREMIAEADRQSLVVIAEMRAAIKVAEEHDDPGTQDLLTRLVQVHEKQEWWLRDILRKDDGFYK